MDNPLSPLNTLRQLKEMLDAGALTPAEFEALKQRLVFGDAVPPAAAAPPEAELPPPPANPVSNAPSSTHWSPLPPALTAPLHSPGFGYAAADATEVPPPAASVPAADSNDAPAAWEPTTLFAAAVPLEPEQRWATEAAAEAETPPARSPLALILSIGGLLALLALVLYLSLNRPPSEHISSTSQTAADSVAAAIETGPQVAPLPPAAAPETVRVAPARPAPRPTAAVRDSVAPVPAAAPTPAPDSAARP